MTQDFSRRGFIKGASVLSAAPFALNLAAIGQAAAATAAGTGSDYKALVCVFLYGGNDYANTLVPFDATTYATYAAQRPGLAYAQSERRSTPPPLCREGRNMRWRQNWASCCPSSTPENWR